MSGGTPPTDGLPPSGQPPPGGYPRQQLSEQHVAPGRSRRPLYVVVALGLVVAAAAVSWLLLRDDGEDGRAEYCAALSRVTDGGDLMGAAESADSSTLADFESVAALAPDAVADDWRTLTDLLDRVSASGTPPTSDLLTGYGALRAIAQDARSECDLQIELPGF